MLKDETILCISPSSWFSLWRNRQQIMSRLAKHNRVLFVEPPINPDWGFLTSLRRRARNLLRPRLQSISANLTLVYPPPNLPLGGALLNPALLRFTTPMIIRINNRLLASSIHQVLRQLKITAPILYLWEPFQLDLVGRFNERLVCYHVYDEIADFVFNQRIRETIQRYDRELCRKADFVFASSRAQYERRKALNAFTYFIPNGVDFEHFNQALSPETEEPEDIKHVPRPILGFVGLIADFMINVKLLIDIAEKRPAWSIVLVGQDVLSNNKFCTKLRGLKNVYFLGKRNVDSLPAYFKSIDVGLMPYVIKGHTVSAYPLKLHEYLAAGLPIVASPLPELAPFENVVRMAASADEFIRQVEDALDDDSDDAVSKRVEIARQNTWEQRVEKIERLLAGHNPDKVGAMIG